ncbi:cell division protein ZapD [Uruburuella testudinis]|uniref:Cell division protein ZapD n=1 Tax=Uruburuella testudinis TaxID=1282863 RepID=A0ABY4DXJ0_9NEIS|nr:cell division protein ZapD [Uruburuella testudinis]UOO83188.1 cell division protein ZapD [Uruburuella testudinis]
MIRFEHPLSERVRSFLRIEHLFSRFNTESVCAQSPWAHHLALFTLFEIMECAGRAEVKLDILQELERQKQLLAGSLAPDAQEADKIKHKLQAVAENLQGVQQKFGQHLRENEWLMAIKQRMQVPGGTSPFDMTSYYYWQQLPHERRLADLQKWIGMLTPTYNAVSVLLGILRSNTRAVECVAQKGNYQHNSLAQNIHMLTIELDMAQQALPEVSANKYFTHIRFLSVSQESARGKQLEEDVPFKLIMCSFDPVVA